MDVLLEQEVAVKEQSRNTKLIMSSKTAILVFANSAQEEALHKPISGGYLLFDELNKTIESVVKSTNLPYYIFSEKHQYGANFGERFTNALQDIFAKGFENIIAVGNDTPFLTKEHLLKSEQLLKENKFVIGPSVDGGFYLVGLHKSQFSVANFLNLPWQSNQLTNYITSLLKSADIAIEKLQVLRDIDTLQDLKFIHVFHKRISKSLLKIIQTLLQFSNKNSAAKSTHYSSIYTSFSYNKGSPVSIF